MSERQQPIIPAGSVIWLAPLAETALHFTVTFELSAITHITPTLRSGGESRPHNLHFFEGCPNFSFFWGGEEATAIIVGWFAGRMCKLYTIRVYVYILTYSMKQGPS